MATYPQVFEDKYGDLIVVLERNGEAKRYNFCEFIVSVQYTDDMDFAERLGLVGSPHADGRVYFLNADPMDYGVRTRAIQLSRDEAISLDRLLKKYHKELLDE